MLAVILLHPPIKRVSSVQLINGLAVHLLPSGPSFEVLLPVCIRTTDTADTPESLIIKRTIRKVITADIFPHLIIRPIYDRMKKPAGSSLGT